MTKTTLFGWFVTSIVVALAGPFGTFVTTSLTWRLLYWGGLIATAVFIAVGFRVLWRTLLKDKSEIVEDVAVSASLALVFGPSLVVFNMRVMGVNEDQALGVVMCSAITFAIAVATIAMRRVLTQPANVPTQDRLLSRLPIDQGVRLCRISSDNHHIKIATSDNVEHRILMRLRDAVNEIDVEPGFCVHRSHWLAQSRIADVIQKDGREMVQLTCGSFVPIGPKYRENLVQAGFISD